MPTTSGAPWSFRSSADYPLYSVLLRIGLLALLLCGATLAAEAQRAPPALRILEADGAEALLSVQRAPETDRPAGLRAPRKVGGAGFGPKQVITTTAVGAYNVHATDLDGDGDPDVLSASNSGSRIAWYENQIGEEEGRFSAPKVITRRTFRATSVYAADLDGDGDRDVLSASLEDNKIAWYENQTRTPDADADGFGAQRVITDGAVGAGSVYTADLDEDGDPDVLSASLWNDAVAWFENRDGAGFGPPNVISTSGDEPASVYAADLDEDGDPDVLSASLDDDKIAWYENENDGIFASEQVITTDATNATTVYAADLDGDVDRDVLSASHGDDTIAWYENKGQGIFGPKQVITERAALAFDVHAADLDGDGDQDVLSASIGNDMVAWYENRGDERESGTDRFGPPQVITSTARQATSVVAADLDGDGDQDAISASFEDDTIAWYENRSDTPPSGLMAFDARAESEGVLLRWRWQAGLDAGHAGFEVWRRFENQRAGTKVGFVERSAEDRGPSEPISYRFVDPRPPYAADSLVYRLLERDGEGTARFVDEIVVRRPVDRTALLGPSPNPARHHTRVRYAVSGRQAVSIRLYDALGRPVRTLARGKRGGRGEIQVDVSSLSSGVYFLRLQAGGTTQTQRLTVVR